MIHINAGVALFVLLSRKAFCRVSEFVEFKRQIERKCSGVFVEVDRKSLMAYVQNYPDYFDWVDGGVQKRGIWGIPEVETILRYEALGIPDGIYTMSLKEEN